MPYARREPREPMEYANKELMNELNEHFITVKIWLFPEKIWGAAQEKLYEKYPRPSVEELDDLFSRVYEVLSKDARPMRRY